jgi:crotonobetainyl-CoA:carnitine CoA-transferase CaiB-like acyl-CoA transferase
MKERTTGEWLALFAELEIPASPINTLDSLFDSPQLNAVGLFETLDTPQGKVRFPGVPTWFSRTPGRVTGPAPELGADTAEVLREWVGTTSLPGAKDPVSLRQKRGTASS